jgi:glycosyltransferase involved in cell wall biosynthesis
MHQTVEVNEIVISDNSSTDGTLEIISSFCSDKIRVFQKKRDTQFHRKNIIANTEFVLSKANGDYIFLADQDDVWLPNKVEKMLTALLYDEMAISDCIVINENGKILHTSFFDLNKSKFHFPNNIIRNPYLGCAMAFRRSVLDAVLPFPTNIPMHDIWIGNACEYFFSVRVIEKPLMYYRRHANNLSSTSDRSKYGLFAKIGFRLNLIRALIMRWWKIKKL